MVPIAGISLYFAYNQFNIHENFTSIPNSLNHIDSTSNYNWNGAIVTIQGDL